MTHASDAGRARLFPPCIEQTVRPTDARRLQRSPLRLDFAVHRRCSRASMGSLSVHAVAISVPGRPRPTADSQARWPSPCSPPITAPCSWCQHEPVAGVSAGRQAHPHLGVSSETSAMTVPTAAKGTSPHRHHPAAIRFRPGHVAGHRRWSPILHCLRESALRDMLLSCHQSPAQWLEPCGASATSNKDRCGETSQRSGTSRSQVGSRSSRSAAARSRRASPPVPSSCGYGVPR